MIRTTPRSRIVGGGCTLWIRRELVLAPLLAALLVAVEAGALDDQLPNDAPSTAQPPGEQAAEAVSASEVVPDEAEAPAAFEDFDDIGLLELEVPTVTTAARRTQSITTVPYAISIVTAEDIRRCGARSVADALRLVPGMDVADMTFNVPAVSPRGFHGFLSRQVLVLVDGRQIFDSVFGGTLWASWPFQLEDIERIEVIRGPAGVTWGANAVNGVINIITKKPKDQAGVTFRAGGGSRGWHMGYLGYAFADDKLQLRVSGDYEYSDGFLRGGSPLRTLDDEYRAGRMSVHALYDWGPDDEFLFSAGSATLDGGYPRSPSSGLIGRSSGSQANFVLGKWTHQVAPDNTLQVTGYVNDSFQSPGMRAIDYRYQQFALQLSHTFKPSQAHTLTWGVDGRVDLLDLTNADPFMLSRAYVKTGTIGAYIQDEWRLAPKWVLNLGGRLDYDTYGGFEPSGRAAVSYQMSESTAIYGAVSRAFQMPPGGLRFLDIPMLDGLARVKSHSDLEAQTVMAYELGHRGRYLDRLDLNVNLFWNEHFNVTTVSPRPGPPGFVRFDEDNRASATIYGAELDARYAASDSLTLLGNYTYQQLDWESIARVYEKDIMSPPRHKFMVGARYDVTDDLHLSSHLYYVTEVEGANPHFPFVSQTIDEYFRLDLLAEYEFWEDRASIAAGVRNLLDNHHPEGSTVFLNDAEVPRMFWAELRLRFK